MASNLNSIARTKNYYLKGVLAVYIIAFTSLYVQVQSLFGENGIIPVHDFVSKMGPSKTIYNIVMLAPKIGLNYGTFIELLCLLGVIVAAAGIFTRRLANALSFGLLWYIYYSICSVGQGFMSFHSDLLLLEVGFITILLAPLIPTSKISQSDHDHLTFFLVKWLVFRYFITNVLNIYLDGDKAWYNMTAIPMVAQGVQFPSLFSWQIFNFQPETIKLYQAYEHSIKLCTPFLILFDLKFSKQLAFYSLIFIALPSAFFFNFGWTDWLMIVCLLSFLKDSYYYNDKRAKQSGLRTFFDYLIIAGYVALVGYLLIKFYGVKFDQGVLKCQLLFTPAQFKSFADHLVPFSLLFGVLGLLSSAYTTYFGSQKKTSIVKTAAYTIIVVGLFLSTFPTLTRFAPGLEQKIKPLTVTKDLSHLVAPYMISNNYILLSKVSQHYADGRPELQIQGRESVDDPNWYQFDFRYKTGNPSKELVRVTPHLPRVDLKLWYAARSSLQNNQWLQTLAYRLASKEKDVVDSVLLPNSIAKKQSQFNQVRVVLQNYKYASKSRQPFAGYWSQSKTVSDYMPATTLETLKFNVKSNGISLTASAKAEGTKTNSLDQLLNKYLEISSNYVRGVDHTAVIWSLSAIAIVSAVAMR